MNAFLVYNWTLEQASRSFISSNFHAINREIEEHCRALQSSSSKSIKLCHTAIQSAVKPLVNGDTGNSPGAFRWRLLEGSAKLVRIIIGKS